VKSKSLAVTAFCIVMWLKMYKILFVIGTRPEAIKLAPLILEIKSRGTFKAFVLLTGQHMDMVKPALEFFGIVADYSNDFARHGGELNSLLALCLYLCNAALEKFKPDMVVVQGDTTSALAGGIAAFHKKVPVAHVEAGLRTGDVYSPYPEEFNRTALDILCDIAYAPTHEAVQNCGINAVEVGNTIVDACYKALSIIEGSQNRLKEISDKYGHLYQEGFILATAHRRENIGDPLRKICEALLRIANSSKVNIVIPVHPNPEVTSIIRGHLDYPSIHLFSPFPYDETIWLISKSKFVLTDSGGIQEECAALNKPVLIMRDTTERPEGVTAGGARLVGTDPQKIYQESMKLLLNES
jgi:UDP-N-acetylglucosamine 2-epimerase (non-hydrolysing)